MRLLLNITMVAGSLAYPALPQAVAPQTYIAPQQDKLERALRQALPSRNRNLPPPRPHVLDGVNNDQYKKSSDNIGFRQVGIHRAVAHTALQTARRDSSVWRWSIQSPGAVSIRLHFTNFAIGAGQVWIHDGSADDSRVLGPYTNRGFNNDGDFWSESVFSDTVIVEYQPEHGQPLPGNLPFAIPEISHRFASTLPQSPDRAAAASCHLDVNCYSDWAFTAKGIARLSYEKSGGSYVCSGSLLNTRNSSFVPYFLTANHCIDNDTVARTLEATWFYQKDACNGTLPNRAFPRTLGSTVLVTGGKNQGDFTLLKLNSVPDGVTFQGWDPAEKPVGASITVVHHPTGDYKRISFGKLAADSTVPQSFYRVVYSSGITEGGSSGSGLFSAPGVLVGTLSTGLSADTQEGYCRLNPYAGTFGKFSSFFPLIRSFLEDQKAPDPTTSTTGGAALTSGVAESFNMPAVSGGTLFPGFTINVPQGATRLDVTLRTTTPNANVDLFVRHGQAVGLVSGTASADFISQGSGGNEQITISASSSPALRAGTYYIAFGLFTPNTPVAATVTATVTTGGTPPPSSSTTQLTSGAARNFTLPAVNGATLFNRESGFKIDVPQGATRLEVKLSSRTPGVDLDLYVRHGQDPVLVNDKVDSDFASLGPAADESVVVTQSSSPALKAGAYYIAIGSFTGGVRIDATITATVTTGASQPPPAGGTLLTSGRAQTFTLAPVTGPTFYPGEAGYRIVVPEGATSLDIVLHTATPGVDVDLLARYNQDIALANGEFVADYGSQSETGEERITINASSNPPLRPATYYIALILFSPGVAVNGTITATVNTGSAPPPPAGASVLTSGTPRTFLFNPVPVPTFFSGAQSYVIDVPANATRLDVQLSTSTPGADVDLFVSHGKDNSLRGDEIVADFSSIGPDGNERITITPSSSPALKPGRYYISLAIFTTGTNVSGSITATVNTGGDQPSAPGTATVLTLGQPARFSLPAVTGPTLFNGNQSFQVRVPEGSVYMRIQLTSDNPSVDVDVFARYGADVALDNNGRIVADHGAEGPTGTERIGVSRASSPPLRPGLYFISLAAFSKESPATGTIVVTASDDILDIPNLAGEALSSGSVVTYSLPAVKSPTLFAGSSAYRIAVDKRHTLLRLSVKGNTPDSVPAIYVRRGQQPAVVNGEVLADFSLEPGSDGELVIDGAGLRPGVYYIALGSYSADNEIAGVLKATLESSEVTAPDIETTQHFNGTAVNPKPASEIRMLLPDKKMAHEYEGALSKQSSVIKKRQRMQEVSR